MYLIICVIIDSQFKESQTKALRKGSLINTLWLSFSVSSLQKRERSNYTFMFYTLKEAVNRHRLCLLTIMHPKRMHIIGVVRSATCCALLPCFVVYTTLNSFSLNQTNAVVVCVQNSGMLFDVCSVYLITGPCGLGQTRQRRRYVVKCCRQTLWLESQLYGLLVLSPRLFTCYLISRATLLCLSCKLFTAPLCFHSVLLLLRARRNRLLCYRETTTKLGKLLDS